MSGDEICQRCGTKFQVDNYCENNHARPRPKPAPATADTIDTPLDWDARITNPPKPAPATGECKAIHEILRFPNGHEILFATYIGAQSAAKEINDLLNAALAAERKGHEMDGKLISSQESEISNLNKQLAAEREINAKGVNLATQMQRELDAYAGQLAAERERTNAEYMELSRRFAAAVEALEEMRRYGMDLDRVEAALARIREGK